jgi:hypothetical protein
MDVMDRTARELSEHQQDFAVKTWRYLRLAMVALVVGLATALVYEHLQGTGCAQGSISAYYYTPVRGYLVGALMAIGLCLYCLKGNTEREDVLLNLAGMAAPVVALVPTGPPSAGNQCSSSPPGADIRIPNVDNNMHALIAVTLFAFVVIAVLWVLEKRKPAAVERVEVEPGAVAGYAIAAGLWLAAIAVFVLDRSTFRDHGHTVAAIGMFACITAVVAINGRALRRSGGRRLNRYTSIAAAMLVSVVACVVLAVTTEWGHAVLVLESALIALFAVFWWLQTFELWNEGLPPRPPDAAVPDGPWPVGVTPLATRQK